MRYEVYMEQRRSTVIVVEAGTWQEAMRLADQEGVDQHEDGDVASEWTSLAATDEDGQEWPTSEPGVCVDQPEKD